MTFRVRLDTVGLKPTLGPSARALLEKEVLRRKILRQELAEHLTECLRARVHSDATVVVSTPAGDHATILNWLEAAVHANYGTLCRVPCRKRVARGPINILDQLAHTPSLQTPEYDSLRGELDEDFAERADVRRLVEAMSTDLLAHAANNLVVLDVRDLDNASTEVSDMVVDLVGRMLSSDQPPVVVITVMRQIDWPMATQTFALVDLTLAEIVLQLEERLGYNATRAASQAATLFAVGQGVPLGVAAGLDQLDRDDRRVIRV